MPWQYPAYSALKQQVLSVSSHQLLSGHATVTAMYMDLHVHKYPMLQALIPSQQSITTQSCTSLAFARGQAGSVL